MKRRKNVADPAPQWEPTELRELNTDIQRQKQTDLIRRHLQLDPASRALVVADVLHRFPTCYRTPIEATITATLQALNDGV